MRVAHDKCGSLLVNTSLVDMYAKKQHLILTFVEEQPLKMINAILNLQIHRHGAPVSERLKLRH